MALWISWIITIAVFAFGAAVQVDFVDPSVPFSKAWNSMTWAHVFGSFQQREYALIFVVSAACVILLTFLRSWKIRLGVLATGFLTPMVAITPMMAWAMFLMPWMVLSALIGNMDGEFYEEGMLMFAACGLWMLLCLVFAVREAWGMWRASKNLDH
ncbi:MAG: hypothetical protein ABIQ96_03930 [Luteolibacter sp.]